MKKLLTASQTHVLQNNSILSQTDKLLYAY